MIQGQDLDLRFSCTNLDSEDGAHGCSDPKVVLYMVDEYDQRTCIGETEAKMNSEDAVFSTTIPVHYTAGKKQLFAATVVDIDQDGSNDVIGTAKFALEQVLGAPASGLSLSVLDNGDDRGSVTIRPSKRGQKAFRYELDFSASGVKDIEWFSKSDPYLLLSRPADAFIQETDYKQITEWVEVHKTEYMSDNLNPDFAPFTLGGDELCKDEEDTWIKIDIFDNSKSKKDTLLSTGYFNIFQLRGNLQEIPTKLKNGGKSAIINVQKFKAVKIMKLVDNF